jgi:hypothetical protein
MFLCELLKSMLYQVKASLTLRTFAVENGKLQPGESVPCRDAPGSAWMLACRLGIALRVNRICVMMI